MKPSSILITAVGGDIGTSAVRALREEVRTIIGCDARPYPPVLDLLDSFYEAPPAGKPEDYVAFLKKLLDETGAEALLPISEPEIGVLNDRREEVEASGIKVLMNNKTILDHFLDKYKTAQLLSKIGLKTPRTALLKEYDGSYGFPLILKARAGYGSKKTRVLNDRNDLDDTRGKDGDSLVVQEYIGSDREEYTTGVFSDGKKISSITFRRRLGFGSLSAEAILAEVPRLKEMAEQIARSTGLVGSINFQSRRLGEDFFVFEVNPRLSSTLLFRKKFGFDDAVWWLRTLNGKPYTYTRQYRSGRAVRYLSEKYFDLEK